MLVILSPAKKLNLEETNRSLTEPKFRNKTSLIIKELKKKNLSDLKKLMKLSDKIAQLNVDRNKNFKNKPTKYAAGYTFAGDTYKGLDINSLSEDEVSRANDTIIILSGLYGTLRVLDSIEAYRLEMGTKLNIGDNSSLYQYWTEAITAYINELLRDKKILINLASVEYSSVISMKELDGEVITPIFKEKKGDSYKVVGIHSKKARGMMARYIVKNDITEKKDIKKFSEDGYKYSKALSSDNEYVFIR